MTKEKATLSLQNNFPANKCSCICIILDSVLHVLHMNYIYIHVLAPFVVVSPILSNQLGCAMIDI